MATVGELLQTTRLERLDTELLLAYLLKQERSFVLAHPEHTLSPRVERRFRRLATRRQQHEPLAYILGEKEFYGRMFQVNATTLIPRPETEILIENAVNKIREILQTPSFKKIAIVDVGTGSGAIIVSIAKIFESSQQKNISYFATDISKRALRVAEKNLERHQLKHVSLFHGHLLWPLKNKLSHFDAVCILANLPYLSDRLYAQTAPDVLKYEPARALVSGADGLDHYRAFFAQSARLPLPRESFFFLEISPEQAKKILPLLPGQSTFFKDLALRTRVVMGTFQAARQE